jgi:hypothetical protein
MLPSPSDSEGQSPPDQCTTTITRTVPEPTDPHQIAAQLEQSILNDIAAVNDRHFSPTSCLFYRKAPYWYAEVSAALGVRTLSCREFVQAVDARTRACPEYRLRAVDFSTAVDVKAGTATVFANMEVSGSWNGLSTSNVTLCEYHRIDGLWYHASHKTMPGMDFNLLR